MDALNRFQHPEGTGLPALERNILKYRAFEMVLVLFYAEHLKNQLVSSIESTDRWLRKNNPRIVAETKKKFRRAVKALVEDATISQAEADEIRKLVDVRNDVAHSIHLLTHDVSRDSWVRQSREFINKNYDYKALGRLRHFCKTLPDRMGSKYVHVTSMNSLLFRAAENTYDAELKRLDRVIRKQLEVRKKKIARIESYLPLSGTEFDGNEDMHPYHPANMSRSGTLSKRGVEICFRLFDLGKPPLAVAYLMRISLKATIKRYKQWQTAGGVNRVRAEFSSPFTKRRVKPRTVPRSSAASSS
jgi:hypothetical protein